MRYYYKGFWVIDSIYKTIYFHDAIIYWIDELIHGRKPTFPKLEMTGYYFVVSRN